MLDYALIILRFHGVWPSENWINPWKLIYKCFTHFVVISMFILFFGEFFYMFIDAYDISDISIISPMFILTIECLVKLHNVMTKQNEIINIINKLSDIKIQLRDYKEEKIYRQYHIHSQLAGLSLTFSYISVYVAMFIKSLLENTLIIEVWIPHWIKIGIPHWILSTYFLFSLWFATLLLLSFNIIYVMILIQLSMHLDILNYRFTIVPTENKEKTQEYLANCIRYQLLLYEVADYIQNTFLMPVTIAICGFGAKLCMHVFVFSNANIFSAHGCAAISRVVVAFITNFILFSEANRVTLKSDAIGSSLYQMNWFNIERSTAKTIMIIMHESMKRPIIFTGILSMSMSNNTFASILKASYKAYCLLETIVANFAMNRYKVRNSIDEN